MSHSDYFGISDSVANELRRMDKYRLDWLNQTEAFNSVAEELRKSKDSSTAYALAMAEPISVRYLKQMESFQGSIKKMLDPISDIRKQFEHESSIQRLVDEITRSSAMQADIARYIERPKAIDDAFSAATRIRNSVVHSQAISSTALSDISHLMKAYEAVSKKWEVPAGLVESLGAIKSIQDLVGKLTLPVIDWPSAATLAQLLGDRGIEAQLNALGIQADGTLRKTETEGKEKDPGIGLSRRTLELMALLSFIAAFLIPYLQELSSDKWQGKTDAELAVQRTLLENQSKQLTALSRLVEIAIEKEARQADQRFVVLDRFADVRRFPEYGSAKISKLFPREVVKPISERGKWIQIEYYDWLRQDYQEGWSLKKYFKRVPASHTENQTPVDFESYSARASRRATPAAAKLTDDEVTRLVREAR